MRPLRKWLKPVVLALQHPPKCTFLYFHDDMGSSQHIVTLGRVNWHLTDDQVSLCGTNVMAAFAQDHVSRVGVQGKEPRGMCIMFVLPRQQGLLKDGMDSKETLNKTGSAFSAAHTSESQSEL